MPTKTRAMYMLQETHFISKNTHRLKGERKSLFHANGNGNKAKIRILDKIDVKIDCNKEQH